MLTAADKVAGEVIELKKWEIPIECAAHVVAAFATDKQKYLRALALVQAAAHRYRIDVVASQYVRLSATAVTIKDGSGPADAAACTATSLAKHDDFLRERTSCRALPVQVAVSETEEVRLHYAKVQRGTRPRTSYVFLARLFKGLPITV